MIRQTIGAVLLMLLGTAPASAGEQQGKVSGIWLHANSSHSDMLIAGTATNRPSCATETFWKLDTGTPEGERLFAALLTASASGMSVTVYGTGTCSLHPTRETVAFVWFRPVSAQ